jgi:hypothetical protein
LLVLLVLLEQHRRGDAVARDRIHRTYLEHARYVNNWDRVQTPPRCSSSAPTSTRTT